MKRIFLTVSALLLCLTPFLVNAESSRFGRSSGVVIGNQSDETASGLTLGGGDLYVAGQLYTSSGTVNTEEVFLAPAAANAAFYKNAVSISSATLATGTTVHTNLQQSETARNATLILTFDVGGSTTTAAATAVLYGFDARGRQKSETIAVSTTSSVGNVPWLYLSSMTLSGYSGNNQASTVHFSLGTGVKIGLCNDFGTGLEVQSGGTVLSDVENLVKVSTGSYTMNTTYGTITFATSPNGSLNYQVRYGAKSR